MSHTKGPWRWSDAYQARDLSDTYSLIGADGYGILSCDGLCNSPQHLNKADAALIADAPAMLDALFHLLALAEKLEESLDGHFDCRAIDEIEADGDLPEQIVKARALIAKHRGVK
jgi:hypothetical protein